MPVDSALTEEESCIVYSWPLHLYQECEIHLSPHFAQLPDIIPLPEGSYWRARIGYRCARQESSLFSSGYGLNAERVHTPDFSQLGLGVPAVIPQNRLLSPL